MINTISIQSQIEEFLKKDALYISMPFYFQGKALTEKNNARWAMTLLKAGTMRFRWNEVNENRNKVLKDILRQLKKTVCSGNCSSEMGICDCTLKASPLELIHSKTVYETKKEGDTKNLTGDGLVTNNPLLVPIVTVADCLPVFLYDMKNKAFASLHSGWKGTGIAKEGVKKLQELYGSKTENICAAIGPHIGDCCYYVDKERAEYFTKNFGAESIVKVEDSRLPLSEKDRDLAKKFPFRLSLTQANLFVLKEAGIKEENILVASDCTCCTKFSSGENVFGSFRRQAAFLPSSLSPEERSKRMTVQAAFTYMA
ncbi:MAG: polyphenol oxidase family protein [Treponema sp.]|nr:polyphenol oxidase family protein [Treponema sp.]